MVEPKKIWIAAISLGILLAYEVIIAGGIALAEDSKEFAGSKVEPQRKYMAGELIIKLKKDNNIEELKALSRKYNLKSIEKVFSKTTPPEESLRQLEDRLNRLMTGHDKWYWQLEKDSKEYRDYLSGIEKEKTRLEEQIQAQRDLIRRIEQRQSNAPGGAVLPELENIFLIKIGAEMDLLAACREYAQHPFVEYAEPNYTVELREFPWTLPNDTYLNPTRDGQTWSKGAWGQSYADLWGLEIIQADDGWKLSQGKGVVVAVVDTGVDYNHEDLKNNIWLNRAEIPGNNLDDDSDGYIDNYYGFDFGDSVDLNGDGDFLDPGDIKDPDPLDDSGHGTHIAGIIAAEADNGIGIAGVAPKAKILVVRAHGRRYGIDNYVKAVKYAVDKGAQVISNSWGFNGIGQSAALNDVFAYAYRKGCVSVVAAGNNGRDDLEFSSPNNIDTVINVAASDPDDHLLDFSSYGPRIHVSGPGGGSERPEDDLPSTPVGQHYKRVNILSTRLKDAFIYRDDVGYSKEDFVVGKNYYRLKGTSSACPFVSGLAALVIAINPGINNELVKQIICNTADDKGEPGKDIYFGYGRINAYNAVNLELGLSFSNISPGESIHGRVVISGSAYLRCRQGAQERFNRYELSYISKDGSLKKEVNITTSGSSVENGILGVWENSNNTPNGDYLLTLRVFTDSNKEFKRTLEVRAGNINYGDVSGNGTVSAYDAALVARYSAGILKDSEIPAVSNGLSPEQFRQRAKVSSSSGSLGNDDAGLIAQRAVRLIIAFPAEH